MMTFPQMRICMGWAELLCMLLRTVRGENTFLRKGSSPPKRYAKAHVAIPAHLMLIRICGNVTISTFSLLKPGGQLLARIWRLAMAMPDSIAPTMP